MAGGAPLGNKNSQKGRKWEAALRAADREDPQALIRIARAVFRAAESGDMGAVKEIGDRLDGKAIQHVEKNVSVEKHIHHHAEEVTKNWLQSLIKAKADRDASIN